jgi:ArsR family transcriptional regulator, arsenate/arsenite/antimonite-responsive transcriptional repressor
MRRITKKDTDLADIEGALKALADGTRLRILGLLAVGEVCVCHIHGSLGLPQSKVSRHLAYLRRAGLVEARKDGIWVHYRLRRSTALVDLVVSSVRHCLGHVATTQDDRTRLRTGTGACGLPVADPVPVPSCCSTRRT